MNRIVLVRFACAMLPICFFCARQDTLYNPSGPSGYKLNVYIADTTGIPSNVSQDSVQSILKTQLSIDSGQAITLFAFVTGDTSKVTSKWNFGDGKDTAGTIVVHTYNTIGQFHAVFSITDKVGFSIADTVVIAVNSAPLTSRIAITTQPQSQVVATGQSVTFSIVTSETPKGYQWKKDGQNISGAVYASYTINGVQRSDSGGYAVVVSGNGTSVESDTAVLKIVYLSPITQPQSETKRIGDSVSFDVLVESYPVTVSFQWKKDGVKINGATQPTYSIRSVQRSDSGGYTVVVSNSQVNVTSAVAVLTVDYAPIINTQPQSQTKTAGQGCTFSVVAAGCPIPAYQWYQNGAAISGATQPTYSIGSVQRSDSGGYTVVVSNSQGNVTSAAVALMVDYLSITVQPQSQTKAAGQSCVFSVIAVGYPLPTYQWNKNGVAISGATQPTYSIGTVQRSDSGGYTVVAGANGTSVESDTAVLKVLYTPVIAAQPITQTKSVGASCTLSISAAGYPPPTYQWNKNGVVVSGATQPTYSIASVQRSDSGGYTVAVSNIQGSVTSVVAVLNVNYAPVIITQPQSQTVTAGQGCTFSVVAAGYPTPTYQWYQNGAAILGATSASYPMLIVQAANAGTYTVTASNGTLPNATSNGAVLTVFPSSGTVSDVDGNVYQYITIGTQTWMVENLKTTHYNDGTSIPLDTDPASWSNLTTPGYCWYNDSAYYGNTYRALYNWYAVNTGKLAPTGWHVPTDSEWEVLGKYLGGDGVAGGPLKDTGTTYWSSPNTGATNASGFSALPGGYRSGDGPFDGIGSNGYWWSATANDAASSWYRDMSYGNADVYRFNNSDGYGFSVRCVRDN